MPKDEWRNPFEIIGAGPEADSREITRRARERLEEATTDEERQRIVRARQELTQHPCTRARHALLEPPGADYDLGDWDRFEGAFRRSPFTIGRLSRQAPDEWPADAFDPGAMTDIHTRGVYPPRAACERLTPFPMRLPDLPPPLSVRELL